MLEPDSKIRIVIVDDHRLIRECLHLVFACEKRFEIVGEAGEGFQAVDVISDLKPDIALLDITLPGISGLEMIPIIKQKSPETKALMLTGKDLDVHVLIMLGLAVLYTVVVMVYWVVKPSREYLYAQGTGDRSRIDDERAQAVKGRTAGTTIASASATG